MPSPWSASNVRAVLWELLGKDPAGRFLKSRPVHPGQQITTGPGVQFIARPVGGGQFLVTIERVIGKIPGGTR